MPEIKPFRIAVPDEALTKLKARLDDATLPLDVDFIDDWSYGAPRADVQRLARYWADGYDWRAQEARINDKLPQFTTDVDIDGFGPLTMHFVHQQSSRPGAIPLLFVHGWPGSFLEVEKVLPLLTEPKSGPPFHVVAPSLPNFGFSGRVKKPGFGIAKYAEAVHKVMLALGYDRYVTQGGDWGFAVTRQVGVLYPDRILASHVNVIFRQGPPGLTESPIKWLMDKLAVYDEDEKEGLRRIEEFQKEGSGYNQIQGTKPNTIGFALADSPVALLAWIYEKLHDWSDDYSWSDDEILTWISVYRFSVAGADASSRIYYEAQHADPEQTAKGAQNNPKVKLGISTFQGDIGVPPKTWQRALGPVVFERWHKSGGHFGATEKPEWLAEDLAEMFGEGGGAEDVTKLFA